MTVRRGVWILGVCGAALLAVRPAVAQTSTPVRAALIVEGASGGSPYAETYRGWVDQIVGVLHDTFKIDEAHLSVLTEAPKAGEQMADAEHVKTAFASLDRALGPDDTLFVMLIGHGSGSGLDAKFNLVGPDLTVAEWNTLMAPVKAHIVFVDTTSGSAAFLKGVARQGRVVVTATNTPAQVYDPVFAGAFIKALTAGEADLDKNGRVSLWEAFVYASHLVQEHYDQAGQLSVEHPVLDDTGDGVGRDASAKADTPTLASFTYLDAPKVATSADPATQALLEKQAALTRQIDDLRARRSTMSPGDFDAAFQKLALELSQVSAEIRAKTGK